MFYLRALHSQSRAESYNLAVMLELLIKTSAEFRDKVISTVEHPPVFPHFVKGTKEPSYK